MSKDKEARVQAPEPTWFVFAIRREPGTYLEPKGWTMRCGEVREGNLPALDQNHEPNLFGVIIARMENIAIWFRDAGR